MPIANIIFVQHFFDTPFYRCCSLCAKRVDADASCKNCRHFSIETHFRYAVTITYLSGNMFHTAKIFGDAANKIFRMNADECAREFEKSMRIYGKDDALKMLHQRICTRLLFRIINITKMNYKTSVISGFEFVGVSDAVDKLASNFSRLTTA